MKVPLTNYEQFLTCAAFLYAIEYGFPPKNEHTLKSIQKIFDKMTIDTPVKTGGVNALVKN